MEDARRKIGVLSAEAKEIPEKLADFVSSTESEIENLEEQIRDLRKSMEEVKEEQQQALKKCHSEIERLTTVLRLLQTSGGKAG
jgi:phage shock protein A